MYLTLASLCRASTCVSSVLAFFCFVAGGDAAAPPNDNCAGALVVPAAGPFPYLTPVVDALDATTVGDPALSEECGPPNVTRSVWFKFTPAATASYTLSVGADTATDFGGEDNSDTMMALYTAPGCAGPFAFVACNDDAGVARSALSSTLVASTPYYVVIWVGAGTSVTNQTLSVQLRVSRPAVPTNDICAGAEIIPAAGPFPYLTSVIDTTLANEVGDPPNAACASFRSVWFKFTPAVAGTYTLSTDMDTATTIYDTAMGIFSNSGGCGGTFPQLDCLDDFGSRPRATITRSLAANTTIYIVVWDYETDPVYGETALQLRVSLAGPPTVVTLPASGLSTAGVLLNLSLNPNNFATRWFFEWGPTTGYGTMTTSRLVSAPLTLTQNRSEPISGFTPGLTYHYRAVGSNSQGKVFGLDQTFIISTNRPVITALSLQPGGDILLQFTATSGQLYQVQGSSNLVNWLPIGGARDLGNGAFDFRYPPGPLPPYRFYKVRAQ